MVVTDWSGTTFFSLILMVNTNCNAADSTNIEIM